MNGYHTATQNGHSVSLGMVMLEEPVDEDLDHEEENNGIYNVAMSRNISWEYKSITLTRIPGYGFGIAVSGGSDNPHFANGDPAIAISDVLKGGPAEGKLNINDRIITANGIKLENVDYGTAVQVLRDSGPTVSLIIKRRIINHNQKITLNKLTTSKLKNIQPSDYGVNLIVKVFVKDSRNGSLIEGDEIVSICGLDVAKLFDFRKAVATSPLEKITMGVIKQNTNQHQQQQSYDSTNGNLYVQPPRREQQQPPTRPPLPLSENINTSPRYINFIKQKNPIGIKLSGGNQTGIYISAVQPNTPAQLAGLKPGDLIIRVNDQDFKLTKEAAIDYLSGLKEGLVSFIVKYVENYRDVLREGRNDLIFLRVNYESEGLEKGDIVKVFDTSALGSQGYEGVRVKDGKGVSMMGGVKAREFLRGKEPYTIVKKVTPPWPRPLVFYSNFNDVIIERLCQKWKKRVTQLNLNDIERVKKNQQHAIINLKPVDMENVVDYAPIVLIVKTDDKNLLKKSVKSSGGSLLRSFNKGTMRQRREEELHRVEEAVGGYVSRVLNVEGAEWFDTVEKVLEEEIQGGRERGVWISEASGESAVDIPNYNVPPPYAVIQDYQQRVVKTVNREPTHHLPLPPLPLPLQQRTKTPTTTPRHLAHTPDPTDNNQTTEPPPQIDRTKKPMSIITKIKPIPPPKPRIVFQPINHNSSDAEQGTYLNLPLGSKVFDKSAFEVYRRPPLIQHNTTTGVFTCKGGTLTQRNVAQGQPPIQVIIPPNAIPPGVSQPIWFHVVDQDEGDVNLLSPLIKFGPENYRFLHPIEIRIPQKTTSTNASVLMSLENHEKSKNWSQIRINKDWVEEHEGKVVAVTVQQF